MRKLILSLLPVALVLLSGCGAAEFEMHPDEAKNSGLANQPPAVCDPFDPDNIISPVAGLKGTIHYLEGCDQRVSTSFDLIKRGKTVNAELFLNRLFVPTRMFNSGFVTDAGARINNEKGELLTEWFALDMHSKLKLSADDSPGLYQLAILSDDGATLLLENPSNGKLEPIVANEGEHPTKMACATQTLSMGADTKIPLRLTYFQGPRYHISLIVMWRKLANAMSSLAEPECGQIGNEYFFTPGTASAGAVPKTPYLNLLSRGWKPLSAGNYELVSGSNRCAK